MINVLRTCHDHPILVILVIYVLQPCRDYSFDLLFMIYVLRTCRDYLFEYFICFHTYLSVYRFDIKNVIKIHFAMNILKRVNMVMWALETKLVQPKGNGSPWF